MSFYLVNDSFAWQLLTIAPDLGAPWRREFWPRGFRIEPKPKTRRAQPEVLNASNFQMSDWRQLQHLLVHRLGAEPRRARRQRDAAYCVTVAPHRAVACSSHDRRNGCPYPVHRGRGALSQALSAVGEISVTVTRSWAPLGADRFHAAVQVGAVTVL